MKILFDWGREGSGVGERPWELLPRRLTADYNQKDWNERPDPVAVAAGVERGLAQINNIFQKE